MKLSIKRIMFSPIVMLALFVATIGVKPACFFWFYQPAPPVKSE
ncbi:cyclic lactone autoinducer peptide [Desulfotomaculum arcticum]|uniref:Cyclic lactone autoinducer peptide n=1 Tax=Desulfotruncus arcticus DSM 17038 TaxID=1121424 RepID=A0A1I2Q1L4_9FIRM|nr:cyclic lactone autoinducer peptide [Desulfotruncus arcticus]SFG22168.1 cyclic lactone autoinducer peptide [Desulfotomaculum arcticum] [Desulfotruncus arcticus DSM 17038]